MWWIVVSGWGGGGVEREREGVATPKVHHSTDCTLAVPTCMSAPPATLSTSNIQLTLNPS